MKKDFFSQQSAYYAKYRPKYPQALYDFILNKVSDYELAWDVATGNGQAASILAETFKNVYATDLSDSQLKHAIPRMNIKYKHELAEECTLPDSCVDLITVATAVHWFDKPKFFDVVKRVLKPNGLLFVWSYGGCNVDAKVDKVIDYFNFEFLLNYWHEGAKENWIDKYQSLILPYPLLSTPDFVAKANYSFDEVMNYMFSWSGVQAYIKQNNHNPLELIVDDLKNAWGDPNEKKEIKWHLHSKCCRKI